MRVRRVLHQLQDRILVSLGGDTSARDALVHQMLKPRRGEAGGYWLQLVIATMLATLGLALSSTAVVIGAMLIAPLMKPLVELAMGLATGSAALALRAAIRTIASIAVVVLVAWAITSLLPFHEITGELEARTAPSLLDLAIAAACALAAAYASLRSDADIATTAAGTSIGISLVPPLCACGYGLAIRDLDVARGAALLFTANLSGILAMATAVFVVAGFARVDIRAQEMLEDIDARRASIRIGRAWTNVAARRLGPFARIVPPLVLLGIVFVPLQRAVGEITHRSDVRRSVAEVLGSDRRRVVQYTLEHSAKAVILRVVVVGDAKVAGELEAMLRARLRGLDVLDPQLSVWAVPDASSLSAISRRLDAIPPPTTPEPDAQVARRFTSDTAEAIRALWPKEGGELMSISLDLDHPERVRLTVLGPPLGAAGLNILASALKAQTGPLSIIEDALTPVEASVGDAASWLVATVDLLSRTKGVTGVVLCVTVPRPPERARGRPAIVDADADVRASVATLSAEGANVSIVEGDRWRATPSRSPCVAPTPIP